METMVSIGIILVVGVICYFISERMINKVKDPYLRGMEAKRLIAEAEKQKYCNCSCKNRDDGFGLALAGDPGARAMWGMSD
jgi:hypothetical protein